VAYIWHISIQTKFTWWHVARRTCIVLLERKFVLIDQNSVHPPDASHKEGKRLPVPTYEEYLSLSLPLSFFCSSFCLAFEPVDVSNGVFSFAKEALGCLFKAGLYCAFKRKRYIIEQLSSMDILESRHRPTALPQQNFWQTARILSWRRHWSRKNLGNVFPRVDRVIPNYRTLIENVVYSLTVFFYLR